MRASISILSWNAADKLERAAQSALAQTWADTEVVVVDNGSTDGSAGLLPGLADRGCRTVRNAENLGFAEGMNIGYRVSDGEVFVPMNCDAVLHPTFVARAMELLAARSRVAVVGPLVYRFDGDEAPWSGTTTPEPELDGFALGLRLSMRVRELPVARDTRAAFKANGACPVLRRQALDDVIASFGVGPFDPVFDTYGEDIDLAFKLWRLGWETAATDAVVAAHERSYGARRRIFDRRGRLRVNSVAARYLNAARHLPVPLLAAAGPLLTLQDLALIARQALEGDRTVVSDVRVAWTRVWRQRRDLRSFRRAHRPLAPRSVRNVMAGSG